MKIILIKGFTSRKEMIQFHNYYVNNEIDPVIFYEGKTSDISEELAKSLADKGSLCEFYWNEKIDDYDKTITAKQSIQSVCNEKYCIIYKEKVLNNISSKNYGEDGIFLSNEEISNLI